ncbi:hypothetical protein E2C01_060328 [Portunus trituberculatus]|uniref:Uncharacterized protein n=1 Tax=Portunus trituberculatus TaxID=210409 RepID=A0A5B7H4Y0_PORTR|nr:hypothetical protein [Portunus trituberculatus]
MRRYGESWRWIAGSGLRGVLLVVRLTRLKRTTHPSIKAPRPPTSLLREGGVLRLLLWFVNRERR